jgi:hypothetical protein
MRPKVTLATALAQFARARVLNWTQVERLLELAQTDVDQAVADVEFEDWWLGRPLQTARYRAIWELLAQR